MIIVQPFTVTDASLASTDVTEADYPAYNPATTYAAGANVMILATHRCYQSLVGSNLNHPPATSPTYWLDIGPTNRWAIFDQVVGTTTKKATSFTYTIQCTGRVNSIAFLRVQATSIRVKVEDYIDGVVYDQTFTMTANSGISDWYAYYFSDFRRLTSKTVLDLPSYLNPKITFTVTNASAIASVGVVVMGYQKSIGRTQYGSSVGIVDYSVKSTDSFGNMSVTERPYSDQGNFNIEVDNTFIDELKDLLAAYRATPFLAIGTECYESTTVYGFYRSFSLDIQYVSTSQCSLEIEGLT